MQEIRKKRTRRELRKKAKSKRIEGERRKSRGNDIKKP